MRQLRCADAPNRAEPHSTRNGARRPCADAPNGARGVWGVRAHMTDITTAHAVLRVEKAKRLLRSGRAAQALYELERATLPLTEEQAEKVLGRSRPPTLGEGR